MARPIDWDKLQTDMMEMVASGLYDMEDMIDAVIEAPTLSPDDVRGVGETTGDDACPSCGCWIPTDDAHDAIFKNEVKFCYYCGMRLRMKGADA